MASTQFRHKCPPEVNPKFIAHQEGATTRNPEYSDHIRRLYDVPDDAWLPIYDTPPDLARLGLLQETGREMAFVQCPDCGAEVVVTRTKA